MHDATMILRKASKGALSAAETPADTDKVTVHLPESSMLDIWVDVLCPSSTVGSKLTAILEATEVPDGAEGTVPWQEIARQIITPILMTQPDGVFIYDDLIITAPDAVGEWGSGTGATDYSDITQATIKAGSFLHFWKEDAAGNDVSAALKAIAVSDIIALYFGPDEWTAHTVSAVATDTSGKLSIDVASKSDEATTNTVVAAGSVRKQPVYVLHFKAGRTEELQVKIPARSRAPFWRLRFEGPAGSPNLGSVVAAFSTEGPFSLGTRHLPQHNGQVYGPPGWFREGSALYGGVTPRPGLTGSEIKV